MNSTAEGTLKKLKQVTREVSLIATLLLPSSKDHGKILAPLLRKLQREKNALVKKLEKTKTKPKNKSDTDLYYEAERQERIRSGFPR